MHLLEEYLPSALLLLRLNEKNTEGNSLGKVSSMKEAPKRRKSRCTVETISQNHKTIYIYRIYTRHPHMLSSLYVNYIVRASAASGADIGAMHIEDSMKVAMKGHLGQGVTPSLLKNSLPLAISLLQKKNSPHRIATSLTSCLDPGG
jgi:hypothetical protein